MDEHLKTDFSAQITLETIQITLVPLIPNFPSKEIEMVTFQMTSLVVEFDTQRASGTIDAKLKLRDILVRL
jgi:hypothetical protein